MLEIAGWKQLLRHAVLISALLLLPAAGEALQVVHPADGTWLYRSGHLIIKGGDTPTLDGMSVDINGVKSDIIDIASPAYRKAFRDFLILEADFDPGENRIKVEGYAGGKQVSEARALIFLADEKGSAPPPRFRDGAFHLPEREKLCQGCHNMNPSPKELAEPNPRRNPCGSCHGKMINRKHVHGPAGVFDCAACHQPDSRPARYLVQGGEGRVCLECHDDKVKAFRAAKNVHGPVEAEMCVLCHDPHASDHGAQLTQAVNDLCLACHETVAAEIHVVRGVSGKAHPLSGPSNPAAPNKPFSCVSCHDPHAARAKQLFQGGAIDRFALCRLCHQK